MKLTTTIAICTLLSASGVFAQSITNESKAVSTKKVEKQQDTSSTKSFNLSLGYASNTIKIDHNEKYDGKGIALSAGKIFNLNNNFLTTTNLVASRVSFDEKDFEIENGSVKTYDFGLTQKLSYNIETNGVVIKPFIEVGFSRGKFNFASSDIEADMDYNKFGGAIGAQLALRNGFAPFIKYTISKMKFDKEMEVTSKVNGVSTTRKVNVENSDDMNADSSTLILGIGYFF